jgi:hypothetical protein
MVFKTKNIENQRVNQNSADVRKNANSENGFSLTAKPAQNLRRKSCADLRESAFFRLLG